MRVRRDTTTKRAWRMVGVGALCAAVAAPPFAFGLGTSPSFGTGTPDDELPAPDAGRCLRDADGTIIVYCLVELDEDFRR